MKQITIGDISIYSEDEDTWDDLIRVVRKANKAYLDSLFHSKPPSKVSWVRKMRQRARSMLTSIVS